MHEDLLQLKILMNFVNFPCMISWFQNVLIPTDQNPVIPPDQAKSSLFASIIYIGNIGTFQHRKLYITRYSSKSYEICKSFLYDFLGSKCFNTTKSYTA